jgi:hypothetical protein
MEFRWVAGLSLWTLLSGPVLTQPSHQPPAPAAPRLEPPSPQRDLERLPPNSDRR